MVSLVVYSFFILLVGKRFLSHVPIYAFCKKRKVIFKKNTKGPENQALRINKKLIGSNL